MMLHMMCDGVTCVDEVTLDVWWGYTWCIDAWWGYSWCMMCLHLMYLHLMCDAVTLDVVWWGYTWYT